MAETGPRQPSLGGSGTPSPNEADGVAASRHLAWYQGRGLQDPARFGAVPAGDVGHVVADNTAERRLTSASRKIG